jgi:hypothetical protein
MTAILFGLRRTEGYGEAEAFDGGRLRCARSGGRWCAVGGVGVEVVLASEPNTVRELDRRADAFKIVH